MTNGHLTDPPAALTYSSVISQDTVCIALTLAALNGLNVMTADIQNTYIQALTSEKHYVICRCEFSDNMGKRALIIRGLYGLKSARASFWHHLASCMQYLGYESCKADPDLWMKKAEKDDKLAYWEYVLLYVDDIMAIRTKSMEVLEWLNHYFMIKPGSIMSPDIYLGGKLCSNTLPTGGKAWCSITNSYVQALVANMEKRLVEWGLQLMQGGKIPMSASYCPELDVSPELNPEEANYFQSMIGILC